MYIIKGSKTKKKTCRKPENKTPHLQNEKKKNYTGIFFSDTMKQEEWIKISSGKKKYWQMRLFNTQQNYSSEMKTFLKQNLWEFVSSSPALKEIFKKVLERRNT